MHRPQTCLIRRFIVTAWIIPGLAMSSAWAEPSDPPPATQPVLLEDHVEPNTPTVPPPAYDSLWFPPGDPATKTQPWAVHDPNRPQPSVVTPPTPSLQQRPGRPPSDAIVLFDGTAPDADLSAFLPTIDREGQPTPGWVIRDGYLEVRPRGGSLVTREKFGDVQLHAEWMVPADYQDKFSQKRGNSGILLMGRYEIQVLDSLGSPTYPDGMAAAVYGQNPPLVNAGLGLDRWQTYDIIFRRPHFAEDGTLLIPATVTVFHNGVLVQDHWHLEGQTLYKRRARYTAHGDKAPIRFQDHGNRVRFRNLWVRPLSPRPLSVTDPSSKP
ncbi:MAG: family 16 glycoside hydrolase [Planctomycetota bacterium]